MSSKGYTSSFRGSNPPGAYAIVLASDFGTNGGGSSNPNVLELGIASRYAILAYSGITNVGSSVVSGGNIGTAPTMSITGFPPGIVVLPGVIDNANAAAARVAGEAAYTYYAGLVYDNLSATSVDLSTAGIAGGNHYFAGNYSAGTSMAMSTGIVLDAQGVPSATFVFFAGSTVNLAGGQSVTLINGAQAENVIWVVGSSLTTVATSNMVGTILAYASVTLGGGTLVGRALAVGGGDGAVSISGATVVTAGQGSTPGTIGIQAAFPLISAESTVDYLFIIPNMGSEWKTYKSVAYARPDGIADPAGIELNEVDCIAPLYPGTGTVVTASYNQSAYFVMNGYLFQATTTGTTNTTFIGFSAFNLTKGATTLDGSVTWTSFGKATLIRARFANVSTTAASPVNQQYDWFEA